MGDVGAYFWKGNGQIPCTRQYVAVLTRQKQAAQKQRACFKQTSVHWGHPCGEGRGTDAVSKVKTPLIEKR